MWLPTASPNTNGMIEIYGIPNCDTVSKSLKWLSAHHLPYAFHNYKTEALSHEKLLQWCNELGWQVLVNKQSTTWRQLSADAQQAVQNTTSAIELLRLHTSVIKRPVVEGPNGSLTVGFVEAEWQKKI
jgi:Spx/MgsR family transcriptional regulator